MPATTTASSSSSAFRLAVFDLDYTVWKPEMYQIWGPPKLVATQSLNLPQSTLDQARTTTPGHILMDRYNTPMTVFDGASFALSEIQRFKEKQGRDIQAGVASCTDVPEWADICMENLCLASGTTSLAACFGDCVEIHKAPKTFHFQRLHQKTGIPYHQMCFFDNEQSNIRTVSQLGVTCLYTPHGMTRQAWQDALAAHGMTDW